jgi:hypothetical protein
MTSFAEFPQEFPSDGDRVSGLKDIALDIAPGNIVTCEELS